MIQTHPAIAKDILRCEVGSTAHGVSVGSDDLDIMGIGVERPEYVLGLERFETYIYRTAEEREGKKSVRSQKGDVDLTVHSLRKFCSLACKGNPSILMLFYSPVYLCSTEAILLRQRHGLFFSKHALRAFSGYLQSQRAKLLGERGGKDVSRPELVEKYGYDTKFAYHALRLGFQGEEYAMTGQIRVPMSEPKAQFLRDVRNGEYPLNDVCDMIHVSEQALRSYEGSSAIPDEPDYAAINQMMAFIYESVWAETGLSRQLFDQRLFV